MSADYVRAEHLRFLRTKSFKIRETAQLLERFFELKARLFGEDKLVQEIKMSDLTPEDIEYWKTGYYQILPQRDLAGRKISIYVGRLVQEIPIETTVRTTIGQLSYRPRADCLFSSLMTHDFVSLFENQIRLSLVLTMKLSEEDQKRGMVIVYYGLDQEFFKKEMPFQFAAARESLPYRSVAIISCTTIHTFISSCQLWKLPCP
jgi:hypothetical protein